MTCNGADIQILSGGCPPLSGGGHAACIKDDLTTQLAKLHGVSKQDAVKLAVRAELDRAEEAIPLCDRFAVLRAAHSLPPNTGEATDKAFFDVLSGGP